VIAGKEPPLALGPLHEGVLGVPEGAHRGQPHRPAPVLHRGGLGHRPGAPYDRVPEGDRSVIHSEAQGPHSIAMEPHMVGYLAVGGERRRQGHGHVPSLSR
jgi:hypothetical protein